MNGYGHLEKILYQITEPVSNLKVVGRVYVVHE